jgi:site-specific recombinase XerD
MVRLASVRGFFRYLLSLGAIRENVWDVFAASKPRRFVPHIFSLAGLRRILDRVRSRIDPRRPRRSRVLAAYYTMFHTLYACGLRVREVCGLTIGDADVARSLLAVRNTKFGKTRLVPYNARTRELLAEYLDRFRTADDGMFPEAPFFLNLWRRPFHPKAVGAHFAHVCVAAGVHRCKQVKDDTVYGGTTVHALRHSFAVHRLLRWYEEGADVTAKLPLLATYMGHTKYHYTQKYLTVLPLFISIAGKLFAEKFEGSLRDLECPDDP